MTVQQLINALAAIPEEHRNALVSLQVVDGLCVLNSVALFLPGSLSDAKELILFPPVMMQAEAFAHPDLLLIPGDVV